MASAVEVEALSLISSGYLLELGEGLLAEQYEGCMGYDIKGKIQQVIMLKEQLQYKVEIDDLGTETDMLVSCMLKAIASYSGSSLSVDPNSDVPNTIINIIEMADNRPYDIYIEWNEFEDTGDVGRVEYLNPTWKDWLPILSMDNNYLSFGNPLVQDDFEVLANGGIRLLANGNFPAIYEGQVLRSVGFSPYSV